MFKVLKFRCVNVNSLANRVLYLRHLIGEYDLSIIAVCKTWLVPSVSSSFVSIDGFSVVRGDGSLICKKTLLLFVCWRLIGFCSD